MSVLIRGMEMPTGNECLILTIYPDGQCFEHVYNGSFGSREERKAVPVPPHGRLIDKDKLMMSLADWWYSSFGQEETDEAKAIRAVMQQVEKSIDEMTVIEAEGSNDE